MRKRAVMKKEGRVKEWRGKGKGGRIVMKKVVEGKLWRLRVC